MQPAIRHIRPPLLIEQVEDALLSVLKQNVEGSVKVEAFPNNPKHFDFANLPAALLVHYAGSQFAARKGPTTTGQIRGMQFALVLLCRSLRGQGGAYNHLEDVRLAVQGRAFAGAGPAEIIRDELEDEVDGVWRWRIMIRLNMPAVARTIHEQSPLMRPVVTQNP